MRCKLVPVSSEEVANADVFKSIKRRLFRSLLEAFERAAFTIYYPDVNVELQIRGGKLTRLEVREIQAIAKIRRDSPGTPKADAKSRKRPGLFCCQC
jgi:hypothetical protein